MKITNILSLVITALLCLYCSGNLKAQSISVGIAPEVLIPFSSLNTVSLAGILEAELPVKDKFALTLATGAVTSIVVNDYKRGISFFLFKAGIKYDLARRMFLNVNTGAALGYSGYGNHFLIGGGAGYRLTEHWEIALRAEDAGASYLALRAGFKF